MSLLSLLFGNRTSANDAINVLSPDQFKSMIKGNKVQLIDVRTPKEFRSGYIKGAKNIDFFSGKFVTEFNRLNKDKPVYLYCRSGSRSRQTAKRLMNLGFKEIYDLKGGILNYR